MKKLFILLLSSLFLTPAFAALKESEASPTKVLAPGESSVAQKLDAETSDRWPASLSYYNPLYFIIGKPDTKVKFGFKYQAIRKIPLYFGYQQVIFWDLFKDSAPMRDINFNPDVFYRHAFGDRTLIRSLDFGGFEHNSNGKAGDASRSYNDTYLRINAEHDFNVFRLDGTLKTYYLFSFMDNNPDLRHHVGYWSVFLRWHDFAPLVLSGISLTARIIPGGDHAGFDFANGAQELGLEFKIPLLPVEARFYVQYYHGYVESLLRYNTSESSLRAGLAL